MWKSSGVQHWIAKTYFDPDGLSFTQNDKVKRKETTGNAYFKMILSPRNTEVRIVPFTLEQLKRRVNERYSESTVNGLVVGIRDGTLVEHVTLYWTPKQFKDKRFEQYFFRKNEPASYNDGRISSPSWPLNRADVIDARLKPYFAELVGMRSKAAESIGACVAQLAVPGPTYAKNDSGIEFSLKV